MQEGQHFGAYQLIKRIAFGGMAEIHLAKATGIGGFEKLLALKVIHPKYSEDQEFIDMLVDEAKIAVQLSHVNVGQIFDLGHIDGTYYIAMEFIDGKDLYQTLVRCSEVDIEIPYDIIAFIAMETAAGLQYAHTKSDNYGRPLELIHRDISPQNVLISYDGEVKIVDFGIAKASQRSRETESGVIKGKFFYMSPEQAWGDDIDARTDIFSTGICLYEMITGEMLYNEDKALALLDMVRRAEIPDMRRKRPDLPPQLEQITRRALAREREHRYQSAGELQAALSGFVYGNWPGFNRRRVADFMRQVFGDQRFVLPMPAANPRPAPREEPIPDLSQSGSLSRGGGGGGGGGSGNGGGLMAADDFNVEQHSVIFDLNRVSPQARPSDPEDDRTVAGVYAAADELPDYLSEVEEAEDERTITEAVWSGLHDLDGVGDDDKTVTLDSIPDARPLDNEPPTGMFDAARLARAQPPPAQADPSMERTRAMMSPGRLAAPQPAANAPMAPPPDEQTRARMSPGRAMPIPAPNAAAPTPIATPHGAATPTPIAPPPGMQVVAVPQPGVPQPGMAQPGMAQRPMDQRHAGSLPPVAAPPSQPSGPVVPPRSTPAPARPSNPAPRARNDKPTIMGADKPRRGPDWRKIGRKLANPVGISIVFVVLLLIYLAIAVLPTLSMFDDPPPPVGQLTIVSSPPGAAVKLDGAETGKTTPATLDDVTVGKTYALELALDDYQPKTESVSLSQADLERGGSALTRQFFLDRVRGRLEIKSTPPGAEIYVRGRFLGQTPFVYDDIERTGDGLTIVLRMPKHRDRRVEVDWSKGTQQTIEAELKPLK